MVRQLHCTWEKLIESIESNTRSMILCGSRAKGNTDIKTSENKHYHVYTNCIWARNPQFNPSKVHIHSTLEDNAIHILTERLLVLLKVFFVF